LLKSIDITLSAKQQTLGIKHSRKGEAKHVLGQCTGRWTEMHAALTTLPQTAVRKNKIKIQTTNNRDDHELDTIPKSASAKKPGTDVGRKA